MVTRPRGYWAQVPARTACHRVSLNTVAAWCEESCWKARVSARAVMAGRRQQHPMQPLLEVAQDDFSLPFSPAHMPKPCSESVEPCRRPVRLAVCMLHCRGSIATSRQAQVKPAKHLTFHSRFSSRESAASMFVLLTRARGSWWLTCLHHVEAAAKRLASGIWRKC